MAFAALAQNLARVRDEIRSIQGREGVTADVRIVAVTKGHDAHAVRAAYEAGLPDVGENRVQEALRKQGDVGETPVRWHLIGHLQTNKASHVAGSFQMVHSVDSLRVATALHRALARRERSSVLPVLVQVNLAQEAQKSGCDTGEVPGLVGAIAKLPTLECCGLMTMAPFTDDARVQRRVFARLRALRDELRSDHASVTELSMGMSGDYREAVAEGATLLRLGTTLFGARPT